MTQKMWAKLTSSPMFYLFARIGVRFRAQLKFTGIECLLPSGNCDRQRGIAAAWTETGVRSQGAVAPPPPRMKPSTGGSVSGGLLSRLLISPKIPISCVIISEGTSFNFSFFFPLQTLGFRLVAWDTQKKRRGKERVRWSDLDFWGFFFLES